MGDRRTSTEGLEFIENEEGYRDRMYLDVAGYPTIGVGHLLRPEELSSGLLKIGDRRVAWKNGLTQEGVYALLADDLAWAEGAVNRRVTVPLKQSEFDALVSFVFNVGGENFRRSTLLRLLNRGDRISVPSQLARWNKAGGKVVRGLVLRREREGRLFRLGDYG